VSIPARAADGKRYLHHLAFLGATPPKIRDLLIVNSTNTKPDNAIDAAGEGMEFADQACYAFADFPEEGAEDEGTEGAGDPPKKPAGNQDPASTASTEFADTLAKKEARLKKVYADNVRNRVVTEVGARWPAGKKQDLESFADRLVEIHDYEFADDESQPSLVQLFINLIKDMAVNKPAVGRKHDFSDPTGGQEPANINRADMAQKF
jgi:hypothetical protein